MISPRSGRAKVVESAAVLGTLAAIVPFAIQFAREVYGLSISSDLEAKATAALVAAGGIVARAVSHWWIYVRRRW